MNAKYVAEVFRIHNFIRKHGFKIDTAKGVFDVIEKRYLGRKRLKDSDVVASFRTLEAVEAYVIGRWEK